MHNNYSNRPICMDVATYRSRQTHCHSGSARELYLYHRSYREVTFGIWVSGLGLGRGVVGDFTLQSMGWTKHNFPGYRSPGIRSGVKLTQLVASVVEK